MYWYSYGIFSESSRHCRYVALCRHAYKARIQRQFVLRIQARRNFWKHSTDIRSALSYVINFRGILTCGNATCRIHGMPGFPCGQSYVPQLRLHIYHYIMQDTFFPITISKPTDTVRERISATGDWYERNKTGYSVILNNRRTRPQHQPTVLIGQGTAQE